MARVALACCLALTLAACSSMRVVPTDPVESYLEGDHSTLGGDELSDASRQYLEQQDLMAAFEEDKLARVLRSLVAILDRDRERMPAFVLAELCYAEALEREEIAEQAVYVASCMLYAYTYLFEERLGAPPSPYAPNFRRACELYNRALGILVDYTNRGVKSEGGAYTLPLIDGRSVKTSNGTAELLWDPNSYDNFFVSHNFKVVELGAINRSYGLGAPCLALRAPSEDSVEGRYLAQTKQAYACTVFMRFNGSALGPSDGSSELAAVLELYDPLKTRSVAINGREVPLEADLTTPLAYTFENAPRPDELSSLLDAEALEAQEGLYMLQPYQRDKIPLVFVHGLLSTQITWLKMMNGVLGDQRIRERYQIWFFFYPTANPIMHNAAVLRDSLLKVRETFDPERADPEFEQMVLVGHSMGGVLSRFMIQSSGDTMWEAISDEPFDSVELPEDQAKVIRRNLFFEPVPHIKRVVFLAAPHRGSSLADGILGSIANLLASIPKRTIDTAKTLESLVRRDSEAEAFLRNPPSGVNSLSPSNPFNKVGVDLPFAERVTYHSIMGNTEAAGEAGGSDGVVPYDSSHLDGAASELVVKSGHSAHVHPKAILEVRRILKLHLDERDKDLAASKKAEESPGG